MDLYVLLKRVWNILGEHTASDMNNFLAASWILLKVIDKLGLEITHAVRGFHLSDEDNRDIHREHCQDSLVADEVFHPKDDIKDAKFVQQDSSEVGPNRHCDENEGRGPEPKLTLSQEIV